MVGRGLGGLGEGFGWQGCSQPEFVDDQLQGTTRENIPRVLSHLLQGILCCSLLWF